jgi:hypothetical protein
MSEPKSPLGVPIPDIGALLGAPEPPTAEVAPPDSTGLDAAPSGPAAVPIPLPMLRAVRGPRSVPASGTLESVGMPRLLYLVYLDTFSGTLRLSAGGHERTVLLSGGLIVGATSSAPAESLATYLVEEEHLTATALLAARDAWLVARSTTLLEERLLTATGLDGARCDALRRAHCEHIVAAACGAATGTYTMEAGVFRPEAIRLHPLPVLWRGIREHADPTALEAFFAPLRDSIVAPTPRLQAHWKSLGGALKAAGVTPASLSGRATFGQVLAASPGLAAALFCMWITEMIAAVATPLAPGQAHGLTDDL